METQDIIFLVVLLVLFYIFLKDDIKEELNDCEVNCNVKFYSPCAEVCDGKPKAKQKKCRAECEKDKKLVGCLKKCK